MSNQIDDFFTKKTKFYSNEHFNHLEKYLNDKEKFKHEINFGTKFKFTYYEYNILNIRPENLFKLQWKKIINSFKKYFPNITYKLYFEKQCQLQSEILKCNTVHKHDVYIQVKYDDKFFDIAIEFNEPNHPKQNDDDKQILGMVLVDKYLIHEQNDNLYIFMKETIYILLQYTCALTNDIYNLVRVNFFKNFSKKNIKKYEETLDIIIELNCSLTFDFAKIKKVFNITDQEGNQFETIEEVVEYLQNEFNIKINFTTTDTWECDTESILILLDSLPKNMNEVIDKYKEINRRAMKMYISSQDEIIKLINEKNMITKNYIPKFIDNFIKFHLDNYSNEETIKIAIKHIITKMNRKDKSKLKYPIDGYVYNDYIIHLLKNKKLI
jgi:hypothetical protein